MRVLRWLGVSLALALLAAPGAAAVWDTPGLDAAAGGGAAPAAAGAARAGDADADVDDDGRALGAGFIVVYKDDAAPAHVAAARAQSTLLRALHTGPGQHAEAVSSPGEPVGITGLEPQQQQQQGGQGAPAPRPLMRLDVLAPPEGGPQPKDKDVIARLQALPGVAYAVRDGVARVQAWQDKPPWNLDRIDQRARPLDGNYSYPDTAGAGVAVYIVDTGVAVQHAEFEGRAAHGFLLAAFAKEGPGDKHGHGTHCAGVAGGKTVGVAKRAALVSVKVLNRRGAGSWSGVIAGLDWAVNDCAAARGGSMCVVSMSLGGARNDAVDDAVDRARATGVAVVVAAGNQGKDACRTSPAGAEGAVTVGATTNKDRRASYSNHGKCVDVYAPGSGITSAFSVGKCPKGDPNCMVTWSGTSMAAPHVAGVAALVWSQLGAGAGAGDVVGAVLAGATPGTVAGVRARPHNTEILFAYSRVL
ncbi:MAG: peptidase S8/S53 domain-containing protein [Monoraphidium minutum]|nr:MAG: peptidase S8/S53 domain-containing protein [Monoraphidium minutum]